MNKIISTKTILFYCPLFIIIYNFTGNLSNDIYLPTLPVFGREFDASNFLVQFTMTIWFIGAALPQIYFGLIANRYGRRPLMLWGGVVFLAATFICMVAANIYWLILGRFFQGVGVSSLNIATFSTVQSKYYENKVSIKFIAWINATGSLAPLLGPVFGSFLYQNFGWRSTFTAILIMGAIALVGLYFFMLETYDEEHSKDFKISFASGWLFYKPVLKNRELWKPLSSYICFLGALIAYLITAPFIIFHQFDIPIKYFGITQIVPFSLFIAGGLSVNWLVNWVNTRTIIFIGFGLMLFSSAIWLTITWISSFLTVYWYIGAAGIYLYGFALAGSPLMAESLSSTTNKGGVAAVLGLSMAVMASISSFLTAIFFKENFSGFSVTISCFIVLGIANYFIINLVNSRKSRSGSLR
ncbi:MAG TPA: MFS transporter [Legionella sp.]|nr:MFS transporter [Legionella sp.]